MIVFGRLGMTGFGDGRECPSVVIPVKIKTGISFDLDPRVEPEDDVFGVHGTILFWRSEPRVVTLGNYGQHPPVVIPVTMGISFRFRSPGQARG